MPRVSIIVTTYNRPHLLARAVESAKVAGRDVEVIVVDDASIDATASVCRALTGIKYIRLAHNLGVAGARNVGILASAAEYIAFLDDDDLRVPGSLELQVAQLDAKQEAGLGCGAMLLVDQAGESTGEKLCPPEPGGDVFWQLLELDFPVIPGSAVVRKECFFRIGLFRRHLSGIDDWDIFVRIAELYPVVMTTEPVLIYRQPTPTSGQGSSNQAAHLTRAAAHQRQLLNLPRARAAAVSQRRQARQRTINRIADNLLWHAAQQWPGGSYRFAAANILTALHLSPLHSMRPHIYQQLYQQIVAKRKKT